MPPSVACELRPGDDLLTVDVLLPNGVIIPLLSLKQSTLKIIKQRVWKEAKRYPLYRTLQSPNSYTFVVVSASGERQELFDENRRLCDLGLFWPTLSLVESGHSNHSRH